jgi:hypothetical protein
MADADGYPIKTCPDCHEELYRCLATLIDSTGGLRSTTQYRHESTGYMLCPRRKP